MPGIIKTADIQVSARQIDFVTSFARNWEALREIMGITRPIKKIPGAVLKTKYAEGTLESGKVAEGEKIPRSKIVIKEKTYKEMTIEKYSKEVTIEAIKDHGYDAAVGMTDEEFLVELQENVTTRFYDMLKTGTLRQAYPTFQLAMAMSIGKVKNKFKSMHKNVTGIAVFVNILDAYEYLGMSELTVQTAFGMQYIEGFLGADIVFLSSDEEIPQGTICATPVNNLISYYVDPEDSDFKKAGLNYVTDGETNLVGFAVKGDYDTATSVAYAIMGFELMAEYLDGVAVTTIENLGTAQVDTEE